MATVVITGSSKGIGMATALILARAGHTVHATMRNPARGAALARIAETKGLPIRISAMDVDNDESVNKAVRFVEASGPIDVLINNAGLESRGSVEELDIGICRAVMETNFFGALRCIRAVLPQMRVRRSGWIINVTSVAGRIAVSPLGHYAASKFALEALSEALAQEVKAFNIRVSIVQPGIIDTGMARRITEPAQASPYPQTRRTAGLFTASLQTPTAPSVVGEKIRDMIATGSWQLRHPVGPDAIPFLQWRASMTDEQWADWNAASDDTWFENVQRDFGLDARPGAREVSAANASV